MFSQLVFRTTPIFLIILSVLSDSDPTLPSGDLFDSELPSNRAAAFSSNQDLFSLDQPAPSFLTISSGEDLDFSSHDDDSSSGSLFSANKDINNKNNNIPTLSGETEPFNSLDLISADDDALISSNSLFDLADCSTSSSLFSADGKKSRLRPRLNDGSERCQNPTSGASDIPLSPGEKLDPSKVDEFNELMKDPTTQQLLENAQANPNHNPSCHLLTAGLLPWGVCSSGNLVDQVLSSDRLVFPGYPDPLPLYQLTHCTLASGFQLTCPAGPDFGSGPSKRNLFCCRAFFIPLSQGRDCVPLAELMGGYPDLERLGL